MFALGVVLGTVTSLKTGGDRLWCLTGARLQGFKLPAGLRASTNLLEVVAHADLLLLCVPTPYVAATLEKIRDHLRPQQARAATHIRNDVGLHACALGGLTTPAPTCTCCLFAVVLPLRWEAQEDQCPEQAHAALPGPALPLRCAGRAEGA